MIKNYRLNLMKKHLCLLSVILASTLASLSSQNVFAMGSKRTEPLDTAQNVDLNRYLGKWYEIARLPRLFEKGCVGVTAEYSLRPDGKIDIKNSCRSYTCNGRIYQANGVAKVVDPQTHSKLAVSFLWPFETDYWILEVDPEYSYAVVGSPDRDSFWILSRSPKLPETLVQSILNHYQTLGFDFSELILTQPCDDSTE